MTAAPAFAAKLLTVVGTLVAAVSCLAQLTPTNSLDNARFLICYNGQAVCKIDGLHATNSPERQYEEPIETVVRRLQTYFYLLSGCKIPIQNLDSAPVGKRMAYTVSVIVGGGFASARPFAEVKLYHNDPMYTTPILFVEDQEPVHHLEMRDSGIVETWAPRVHLQSALDAFGQRYFGVPVSAIDDTNFDWSAHHTNTLAISYADFQPIRFGPGP
jgi:hypothetical protein